MKTLRQTVEAETENARTQIDLDKIWASGFAKRIQMAFPSASASEIMYEWDCRKIHIRKMTTPR